METITLELPALYADHHVTEVRRILLELPGVESAYVSSAFHMVELIYDPAVITPEMISDALDKEGYLGELPGPVEAGASVYLVEGKDGYFRHTAVYENIHQGISFAQQVSYSGRALWPCPGVGPIKAKTQEEE